MAAAWYEAAGYSVLERNWRCPEGEIDLVARLGATLVFCEVKTRRTTAFGAAAEAVTAEKRQRLRRLASRWLRVRGGCRGAAGISSVRFDVVAVQADHVSVVQDAW